MNYGLIAVAVILLMAGKGLVHGVQKTVHEASCIVRTHHKCPPTITAK